jgi:prepilin-type N-terminal cleavage/methylation domain-containing protein
VSGRAGFSLPEALIALTISAVLVMLVGTAFLVQNNFYAHVLLRSQVQENARALTDVIAAELRSVTRKGVILADSSRLVFRSPIVTAMVCGEQGGANGDVFVHMPGGVAGLTTSEVAGFGYLAANGTWTYYDNAWSALTATGGNPKQGCASKGADTLGAGSSFVRLKKIDDDTGVNVPGLLGATILLYRKTEFKFAASTLISGERALYRGLYGGTLTELATGLTTGAHFEYRVGTSSTWSKSVTGSGLDSITRVRLVAQSEGLGETSQQANYDFGWTVDIPIPNAL